jgi:hypothetical protein
MTALLLILAAIVIGLVLLAPLIGRALWWFCEVGFPAIILFVMRHL